MTETVAERIESSVSQVSSRQPSIVKLPAEVVTQINQSLTDLITISFHQHNARFRPTNILENDPLVWIGLRPPKAEILEPFQSLKSALTGIGIPPGHAERLLQNVLKSSINLLRSGVDDLKKYRQLQEKAASGVIVREGRQQSTQPALASSGEGPKIKVSLKAKPVYTHQ